MIKIGNLFVLAETQLIKEKQAGIIPCYGMIDVIEYAQEIRKWLDNNPKKAKEVMKLSREELKEHNKNYHKKYSKQYYLKRKK